MTSKDSSCINLLDLNGPKYYILLLLRIFGLAHEEMVLIVYQYKSDHVLNPFQTNRTFHNAIYNEVRIVHCLYLESQ